MEMSLVLESENSTANRLKNSMAFEQEQWTRTKMTYRPDPLDRSVSRQRSAK